MVEIKNTVRSGWSVPKNLVDGNCLVKSCTRTAVCCKTDKEGMWQLRKAVHASSQRRSAARFGCALMLKESRGRMMSVGNEMLVESMGFPPMPLLELRVVVSCDKPAGFKSAIDLG